jgi:hypothetical protein
MPAANDRFSEKIREVLQRLGFISSLPAARFDTFGQNAMPAEAVAHHVR